MEATESQAAVLRIELNGERQVCNGLNIEAGNTTVKGLAINQTFNGIVLYTGGGNSVIGNYIGTDISGTQKLGNTTFGIEMSNEGDVGVFENNIIGGTTAAERNVISGNDNSGFLIKHHTTTNNKIIGNYIGVDVTGETALGNGQAGIQIEYGATGNIIGGTTMAERNIISSNSASGILLQIGADSGAVVAHSNTIIGNYIGTNKDGDTALGNELGGIQIADGSSNNKIGSSILSGGNLIAHNNGSGVMVFSGSGNTISANSIHSNYDLGIDLGSDGPTDNDYQDPDDGPNSLQNYPVLASAMLGESLVVEGTLNSAPNADFFLEFYSSSPDVIAEEAEGQSYIGTTRVRTDANGDASFSASFSPDVSKGHLITATATDIGGNTSEFGHPAVEVRESVVVSTCDDPRGFMDDPIEEDVEFCAGDYELNLWHIEAAFKVGAPGITIECEPGTVFYGDGGTHGIGIFNSGHDGVTVRGCEFRDLNFGIISREADNVYLDNVTLAGNRRGVQFAQSRGSWIDMSTIVGNTKVDIAVYNGDLTMDWYTASHGPDTLEFLADIDRKGMFSMEEYLPQAPASQPPEAKDEETISVLGQ